MLFDRVPLAMRAPNIVALAMLFVAGWTLAQCAGGSRSRGGAAMVATGAFLVAVIMALGG
jgi:VIT1/CCC1 family predicted Fe2+/Mn2+ transporter